MARVHFGWTMPSGVTRDNRTQHLEMIERGLEMVKGQFDSAWLADHLQFENRDVLESWTALAYVAARHPEFQFGNAVLCQSFRNPGLVAKMGATLQFLSEGRFILGLG